MLLSFISLAEFAAQRRRNRIGAKQDMCLRSTPRPPTAAVGTAFAGEGEGGIESVVPQGGAALSYLGGIESPQEEG